MLSNAEVSTYLRGLWLLIKGDAMGSRYLDLTDRGFNRSFLAPIVCLPALFVTWLWWAMSYQAVTSREVSAEPLFYLRLALVEAICWIVPFIFLAALLLYFKEGRKFTAIVTCVNWLSVPFTYIYAGLILVAFMFPFLQATIALIFMGLLLALVFSYARIIRFFIRDQSLLVFALVISLLVPQMVLAELLQRFLGIYPV